MVGVTVGIDLGGILASVVALWYGSRFLVDGAVQMARRFGLSELTIGLTIVAVGTSTPELVVTGDAALAGLGDIAVGNIVGSNIYNLAVVLGVVALFRQVPVDRAVVRRDGLVMLAATLVVSVLVLDLRLTRLDGGLLVAGLAGYLLWLVRSGSTSTPAVQPSASPVWRATAAIVGGLVLVIAGGHLLVVSASDIARLFGVPAWAIGATVVAAGTSTPELAVSLVALRQGRVGVSLGNVIGSNVFNLLGALGVAALLRPLTVAPVAVDETLWLLALTSGVLLLLWTGRTLSRPEGGLLVLSEAVRWASRFLMY
ncbi:MAG: calcium/sodium antiporter [Halohasta sp.]